MVASPFFFFFFCRKLIAMERTEKRKEEKRTERKTKRKGKEKNVHMILGVGH